MSFARKAGFRNVSLDLIFGLPWQNLRSWEETLTRALNLKPDHLSIYSLIIEPGTVFYNWYQKGKIVIKDQDLEADMYELTMHKLEREGFKQYEISNWARTDQNLDFRSHHNLQYWLNLPFLGFGAGAHGYANHIRTENVKGIKDYIKLIEKNSSSGYVFPYSPTTINSIMVDEMTQMRDFMLLGLRLVNQGVTENRFTSDFGLSMKNIFKLEIEDLIAQGLIYWVDKEQTQLRLTKRGILLANRVFRTFV
jgi:oxygen-independent coproporphyrinogen-3 oxidase